MQMTRVDELSRVISILIKKQPAHQEVLTIHKSRERLSELHNLAAFAHAAAASAHNNGDTSSAAELSKQANAYSLQACQGRAGIGGLSHLD